MSGKPGVSPEEVKDLYRKLKRDAERGGYHLNPDEAFTMELVEGLLVNERRYGYQSCPCRLSSGRREEDLDIICPCDYRDPDLTDYDTCYCGLYVSGGLLAGRTEFRPIPERRPPDADSRKRPATAGGMPAEGLSHPVWRCRVCGYLCARDDAPEVCPICKAAKDRFERFM